MKKATTKTTTETPEASPKPAPVVVVTTSNKGLANRLFAAITAAKLPAKLDKQGGSFAIMTDPGNLESAKYIVKTLTASKPVKPVDERMEEPVGNIDIRPTTTGAAKVHKATKGADPKAEPGVKGSPKEPKPAAKVATLKAPKAPKTPKTPKTPKEPKTKAPKELILKVLAKGVLYFPKVATDKLAGLPYVAIEVKGNKLTVTPTKSAKDTLEVRHNQVGIAKLLKETAWTKTSQDLPVKMVGDSMQIEVR